MPLSQEEVDLLVTEVTSMILQKQKPGLVERVQDLEVVVTEYTHVLGGLIKKILDLEEMVKVLSNRD